MGIYSADVWKRENVPKQSGKYIYIYIYIYIYKAQRLLKVKGNYRVTSVKREITKERKGSLVRKKWRSL